MINVIIIDIDDTVAKKSNRGPFDWTRVHEDDPIPKNIKMAYKLIKKHKLAAVFLTGREEPARRLTELWLKDHIPFGYVDLLMRGKGDRRRNAITKMEIYEKQMKPRFNIKFVMDDNEAVIQMFDDLNIGIETILV